MKSHFCKAFDANHNPCPQSVETGQITCSDHTDFYTPRIWFNQYPLNIVDDDDYFFSSNEKLKTVYNTAILEGLVKITQEHFQDLVECGKPIESLIDYYLLCCKQPGVDPLWNFHLFNETSKQIMNCHTSRIYDMIQEDKSILYRLLDPIFNNDVRDFDSILYHLLYNLTSKDKMITHSINEHIHLDNQSVSLIQYIEDHPKFSSEFLWKHSKYNESLISMISSGNTSENSTSNKILTFLLSLPDKRRVFYESRKAAFKEKADEIISITWAPERFLKWCMTNEEVDDIKNRFT